MGSRRKNDISEEEIKTMTGPRVWPSCSAEKPSNRLIQRRPEIAFIIARKKILEEIQAEEKLDEQPEYEALDTAHKNEEPSMKKPKSFLAMKTIDIKIMLMKRGSKYATGSGTKIRFIIGEDAIQDIKSFLMRLRERIETDIEPFAEIYEDSVKIEFKRRGAKKNLLAWQEQWL